MRQTDHKLRSFKLTVSPKYDIPDEVVISITKYLQSNTAMCHIVLENGESGKLHLHALMCYQNGVVKRNIADTIWKRFVKPECPESIQRIAVRVDVNYDNRWIKEYLCKESTCQQVFTNYDPTRESEFYPPEEIQVELQNIAIVNASCDPVYTEHEQRFNEWLKTKVINRPGCLPYHPKPTPELCCEYFKYRMYVQRDMKVIEDERRLFRKSYCLYEFSTKNTTVCATGKKFFQDKTTWDGLKYT